MDWENIIKVTTYHSKSMDEAAEKVVDEDKRDWMGTNDIYFLSKFLKAEGNKDKYSDDENGQQGAEMIALGEELEKLHDELEGALIEASELLQGIGK